MSLTQKEKQRLEVIRTLAEAKLLQKEAAEKLNLSVRQVRRLLRAYEAEGKMALKHGLRGRPSNNRFSDEFKSRVLKLTRQQYHDLGPTAAAKKLADNHNLHLSRETLRGWMIEADLWQATAHS